jgi:adenylate cyclase
MAKDDLSGKLAVILHADVAGSTQLVQQDEQLAHERIQDAFGRFSDTIGKYHGQVQELRGDALLAEFERASDAVTAVLAFQSSHHDHIAKLNDEILPRIRVGIALGEVVIADSTVTGAGVVLAQRVEQLAEPGGLCITSAIHEALPNRMPFSFDSLGDQVLKGFEEQVRVYRVELGSGQLVPPPQQKSNRQVSPGNWRWIAVIAMLVVLVTAGIGYWSKYSFPQEEQASMENMAFPLSDKPSIAVLPFANMSGDTDQEYFADGITEDLTTDLSKISGLFVIARNSAFSYKGRHVDVRTVGDELGVRYVLEGSIRRANNHIRINAQLIDAASGGHIWADRFDGTMADVFALQDRVNRKIVTALEVSLTAADEARFNQVETSIPEAYDLLLQGVELYNVFNREAILESRDLFMRAVELDPNYARALANIALTHATAVNFLWTDNREASIRKGLEFARQALELDDTIPQIYLTRSILYLSQRQHQAALEAAKRTIEVHPNYADGHVTLGFISSYSGEYDQALEALANAKRINPNSTGTYLSIEGRVLFLLKRYSEALPRAVESVDRNPGFYASQLSLAAIYAKLGQLEDAAWAVEEALAINPGITLGKLRHDSLYLHEIDIEHYLDALRIAGVPE